MKFDIEFLQKVIGNRENRKINFDKLEDKNLSSILEYSFECLREWIAYRGSYTKSKVASFILSLYRWLTAEKSNKLRFVQCKSKKPKIMNYEVRDIIFADFGATNYGVEASFEHPAIVLHNGYYFLVVIPGSTGRYGKGDYVLNATKNENFKHHTGIQIDQIRVIDKSRVIRKTGKKVPVEFMDKINEVILEKYLVPVKKKINNLEKENEELRNQIKNLQYETEKIKNVKN